MKYELFDGILYQGDCIEQFKNINDKTINTVITSPPYNIIRPNATDRGYDKYKDGITNEEYSKWTLDIFEEYNRVLKDDGVVLYNMSYGSENTTCMSLTISDIISKSNFILADIIVWKKKTATPNNVSHNKLTRICEFIYVFCRKDEFGTFNTNKKVVNERETGQKIYENKFNYLTAKNNDESTELNKATFSTELVFKLLELYSKKGDTILDNFSGTGTTFKASVEYDCEFIGIELSKKQCEYTVKRMNKGVQLNIF